MLEALVIVLREGVEAALVLAIVLSYLKKTGRDSLAPYVYAGVGLALVGSVAGAYGLETLHWNPETFEGFLMLAGAACVITLVVWMNRAAKGLKRTIESQVEVAASKGGGSGWGVLVFSALMILREGVETVLFLAATSFTSSGLARLIGAGLGLALAAVFAVFLIRGSLKVDLGKFFRVTTLVLYVLAFQLIVGGLHELAESGIVPSTKAIMAFVGPIVRYDTHIFLAALVLAIGLVAVASNKSRGPAAEAGAADTAAQRRLVEAEARRQKRSQIGALVIGLLVTAILLVGVALEPGPPPKALASVVTPDSTGTIELALASVKDGRIHFFEIADPQAPGTQLRFFAIEKPDGHMQACMDACEICGDLGYYEESGGVTCRNCSAPINLATLGETGGCNPIPVVSREECDRLLVDAASIYSKRILARGKR